MSLTASIPNVKAPSIPSAELATSTASSTIKSSVPSVKAPSLVTSAASSIPSTKSLTRGALPEPKLGLSGLNSSPIGSVNVKSIIGDMKPALASLTGMSIPSVPAMPSTSNITSMVSDTVSESKTSATSAVTSAMPSSENKIPTSFTI